MRRRKFLTRRERRYCRFSLRRFSLQSPRRAEGLRASCMSSARLQSVLEELSRKPLELDGTLEPVEAAPDSLTPSAAMSADRAARKPRVPSTPETQGADHDHAYLARHDGSQAAVRRWIAVGALAGALAVLVFHPSAAALLFSFGMTERAPYAMQATPPLGVSQLWSITFWGGVRGALLAATLRRFDGARLVVLATLFRAAFGRRM